MILKLVIYWKLVNDILAYVDFLHLHDNLDELFVSLFWLQHKDDSDM